MIRMLVAYAALCASAAVWAIPPGTVAEWAAKPAHAWAEPAHMMLLDATRAGKRIVAVGEHGVIIISDDEGKTWRQAHEVPVSATLSAVTFADAQRGWAVGQWGVILATTDGGETWQKQRTDLSVDQPLFSVLFTSEKDGIAVGLWSLMVATHDGGKTWAKVTVPKPPGGTRADRNLYHIFADQKGSLYIDSEQGMVLKSTDSGANWSYLSTGGKGTLWTGVALPDGRIVVGGLLGSLYQSVDGGATWTALNAGTKSSITDLVADGNSLVGVGLDGLVLKQGAGGKWFEVQQREDRSVLTAATVDKMGNPVLFSQGGVLAGP